jgi:hypothetical protein
MLVRKLSVAVVLVVAAVLSSAALCSEGAETAAKWLSDARPVAQDAKPFSVLDDASRTKLNKVIADAPPNLSGEAASVRSNLLAAKSYQDTVLGLMSDVQRRSDVAVSDMRNVAARSVTSNATTTIRTKIVDFLYEHGAAVIKDVACDLYWQAMTSNEQGWARTDILRYGYQPTAPNFINNAGSLTSSALLTAIENDAETFALRFLPAGYANFVLWFNYGSGVIDKVNQLTSDRRYLVAYPNGGQITRAWFYYVQLCMRPPGH